MLASPGFKHRLSFRETRILPLHRDPGHPEAKPEILPKQVRQGDISGGCVRFALSHPTTTNPPYRAGHGCGCGELKIDPSRGRRPTQPRSASNPVGVGVRPNRDRVPTPTGLGVDPSLGSIFPPLTMQRRREKNTLIWTKIRLSRQGRCCLDHRERAFPAKPKPPVVSRCCVHIAITVLTHYPSPISLLTHFILIYSHGKTRSPHRR